MTQTDHQFSRSNQPPAALRRGWTTGACATAALKAALDHLWGGQSPDQISITLPRGENPTFTIKHHKSTRTWSEIGIIKDAGDDPDVTHGALIIARAESAPIGQGLSFHAGDGVGIVTKAGLPLPVGDAAINPAPRQMMREVVELQAKRYQRSPDVKITISIPNGVEIAKKTWNPRLGIEGGLSVLGTTGIVRPFSCAAWIASIHRGIDVARAQNASHIAGCTGATSEQVVQKHHHLPDWAMIDMGDFIGGMLKYLKTHPVEKVTIGGGLGKMIKFAQGARDLHSARSQIDFEQLAVMMNDPRLKQMNTALQAYQVSGPPLAKRIAKEVLHRLKTEYSDHITFDVILISRSGEIIARTPS